MEAAIRFSQNSLPGQSDQHFLKIDLAGRLIQLYRVKDQRKSKLKYELVNASSKLQPFRAFDWHPTEATFVAVGQTGGEASLVNLAGASGTQLTFAVRSPRSCNAVGLNTQNWLAAGLEKVRNDFCLNIWDFTHRANNSNGKGYGKGNEPLHKLAGGEPITSLRFFQDQPQLLAAGVKGQFVRLYDLRQSSYALQFATRCVNNIAVDTQDDNFFASCLPAGEPTVTVWDRRMVTRTSNTHVGFGSYISHASEQPEASVELKNIIEPKGQIWGMRFSKTLPGQFGVLSSTGQLKIVTLGIDSVMKTGSKDESRSEETEWTKQSPQSVYLDRAHNFSNAFDEHPRVAEAQRVVSFDFTTATPGSSQAQIITLTDDGAIDLVSVKGFEAHYAVSPYRSLFESDAGVLAIPEDITSADEQEKDNKRFLKKFRVVSEQRYLVDSLLQTRARCEKGYLIDAKVNQSIVQGDDKLRTFWSWLSHAHSISRGNAWVQGEVDFSYLGIFALWMEEVDIKSRSTRSSSSARNVQIPSLIRAVVRKHNLARGKGCATEYPVYRALCLHLCDLPWIQADVQNECDRLISANEHTKAAAVALFASEDKIAQRALRATGSGRSHKMLAMALLGAKNRYRRLRRSSHGSAKSQESGSDADDSQDEEWQNIISAVAEDLTDCYARSIFAFVKTGNWDDVLKQQCLPLRHRINIALRHLNDHKLTRYLSNLKQEVITDGNLEGIAITGLGTIEAIDLLRNYARNTNDLQTAALGMSFAAASDRYLPPDSPHARTVFCYRETYKARLMSLGLKFEKARFDVAVNRAIRESGKTTPPRKKEQIRLVCAHCDQAVSQFGHDQQVAQQNGNMTETTKHPLAPERAAVAGIVCPRCGRHLPRCGVCDMWLGTPDETFSKWYKPPSRPGNSMDLGSSVVGSTITAIGSTPSIAVTRSSRGSNETKQRPQKGSAVDLLPNAIEVVDEQVAKEDEEKRFYEAMHKLTVFCTVCSHGFHAEHARMWFDGINGREGHRGCPVPGCECLCMG